MPVLERNAIADADGLAVPAGGSRRRTPTGIPRSGSASGTRCVLRPCVRVDGIHGQECKEARRRPGQSSPRRHQRALREEGHREASTQDDDHRAPAQAQVRRARSPTPRWTQSRTAPAWMAPRADPAVDAAPSQRSLASLSRLCGSSRICPRPPTHPLGRCAGRQSMTPLRASALRSRNGQSRRIHDRDTPAAPASSAARPLSAESAAAVSINVK